MDGRSGMSTENETQEPKLASNAWLRHGPKGMFGPQEPGMLTAVGNRVSFVTKNGPVFEANRADIGVNWPRSEFGGGVHLTVGGKVYRLALVKPKGVPEFDKTAKENLSEAARDALVDFASEVAGELFQLRYVARGRESGKAWKEYFASGLDDETAR